MHKNFKAPLFHIDREFAKGLFPIEHLEFHLVYYPDRINENNRYCPYNFTQDSRNKDGDFSIGEPTFTSLIQKCTEQNKITYLG